MFKKLVIFLVLFSVLGLIADENDSLSERYVKKVIIEAKWGDGEGEFGMDAFTSPPMGPGPLTVDDEGDIYILDGANKRINKFDKHGKYCVAFKAPQGIVRNSIFLIKNDTLYTKRVERTKEILKEKLVAINTKTGEIIAEAVIRQIDMSVPFDASKIFKQEYGRIEENKVLFIIGDEKFEIERGTNFGKLRNVDKVFSIKFVVDLEKDKGANIMEDPRIIEIKTDNPKKMRMWGGLLSKDRYNCYYVEVSSNWIYKFSSSGKLLATIEIPSESVVGERIIGNTLISQKGNIWYLYRTGKTIEKDWKQKFIPGKVQVIKWELQR